MDNGQHKEDTMNDNMADGIASFDLGGTYILEAIEV